MPQKSKLTAWERWELASFDPADVTAPNTANEPEVAVPPAPTFSAEEIAALREQARVDGFAEGKDAGYEAGHDEGLAAGKTEAEAAGREQAELLASVVEKFETQLGELDQAVAEELTSLALEIARQVLRQTIAIEPETIITVIREALAQLPLQHAAIHLHPDDASLARSYAGDQLTHAGHRIHENPKLARGDVVIESGGSHLDATVATRWQRVIEALGKNTPWVVADEPKGRLP